MWQTQTFAGEEQTEDAQPRRVGERLEQPFMSDRCLAYFVLTNIARTAYVVYIRFREYLGSRHMSDIQQAVRDKYGAIATAVTTSSTKGDCCGPTPCGCGDPITSNLYSDAETSDLPADAVTGVARLRQPDGAARARAGPDRARPRLGRRHRRAALAKRVGPAGKAYGLD